MSKELEAGTRFAFLTEFELQALVHAYSEVVTEAMEVMLSSTPVDKGVAIKGAREEADDAQDTIGVLLDGLQRKLLEDDDE